MIGILKNILSSLMEVIVSNLSDNQTIQNSFYEATRKLQSLINFAILRIMGLLLIVLSISNSYFFLAEKYDNNQPFDLGLVGASGIVLTFIGFIAILYPASSKIKFKTNKLKQQFQSSEQQKTPSPPSLEQAIAAFIIDLIKEREDKRSNISKKTNEENIKEDELNIH